jgi:sialate O-acetylesterase
MKRKIEFLAATLVALVVIDSHAEQTPLRFANIFNSNMVLQQKKTSTIWGWAAPGSKLTVTIEENDQPVTQPGEAPASIAYREHNAPKFQAQNAKTVAAKDGSWRVEFPAMNPSFRSKRITVGDDKGNAARIENILVGEVWVCSGQSNMVWTGALNKDLWMNGLHLSGIRYTKYDFSWYRPLNDLPLKVDWNITSDESMPHFSAVAYVFARNLHLNLGVPIGIINNARGGTLGISWTSREELQAIKAPVVAKQLAEYEAQAKEWESEEYLQRLAKAKADIVNLWRPRAKKAVAAWWAEHDKFMAKHLDKERLAEWRKIAADWHEAIKLKHNGGPDNMAPWKVWGLERKAQAFFKGTEIKAPAMHYKNTLWKERPDDKELRSGWSPPAGMFNAGVHPLKGMAIAGALYYQGENNVFGGRFDQYQYVFPTIIPAYRKLFGNEQLPFGIIGMPGCGKYNDDLERSPFSAWARIRDSHSRTHAKIPNTGLIVTYDCGQDNIHPNFKQPVGERASRWALAKVYGKKIAHMSFRYRSFEIRENRILVRFEAEQEREKQIDTIYEEIKNSEHKRYPASWQVLPSTFEEGRNPDYRDFQIAGEDRRWFPAEVRPNVKERALEVWSDLVEIPVAVRYAWANFPIGNLGTRIAPVPAFRSDDWPYPKTDNGRADQNAIKKNVTDRKIRTSLNELDKLTRSSDKEVREKLEALKKVLYPEAEKDQ